MMKESEMMPCGETPVVAHIPIYKIIEIREVLIEQRDNCNELLVIHDSSLGRTTKKNEHIAKMYEDELSRIDRLVASLMQY